MQAWWKAIAAYHQVDGLKVTCGLTARTPGLAPGPALGNEYTKTLPFLNLYLYKMFVQTSVMLIFAMTIIVRVNASIIIFIHTASVRYSGIIHMQVCITYLNGGLADISKLNSSSSSSFSSSRKTSKYRKYNTHDFFQVQPG